MIRVEQTNLLVHMLNRYANHMRSIFWQRQTIMAELRKVMVSAHTDASDRSLFPAKQSGKVRVVLPRQLWLQ